MYMTEYAAIRIDFTLQGLYTYTQGRREGGGAGRGLAPPMIQKFTLEI